MLKPAVRRVQRGTSITELLVALTIGAIVVAAALVGYAQQTKDARRTLLQLRLEQDLRAAGEAVAAEARRSGFVAEGGPASLAASPSGDLPGASVSAPLELLGVRLRNGVLQTFQGAAGWQPLTDPDSLLLTRLEAVDTMHHVALPLEASGVASPSAVAAASTSAPPTMCPLLQRRRIELIVEARSSRDAALQSRWQRRTLLRNDRVVAGPCVGAGGTA